nr:flagellar biosynthetic protein FliO [uncultured Rhodoferax sp.]
MSLQLLPVILFLFALACVPFLIRWLKTRVSSSSRMGGVQSRFVSAVAVGPHQRVVTVEVGPLHDRVWLTLGVSANGIQCLHTAAAPVEPQEPVEALADSGRAP